MASCTMKGLPKLIQDTDPLHLKILSRPAFITTRFPSTWIESALD
jgi:hypothetical protein